MYTWSVSTLLGQNMQPFMTCRPARRAACRYFVYSVVQKRVFRPQGRQTPLINMGSGAKFHVYRCRNVGIHYPRSSTFGTLPTQLPLEGNSFAQFFFTKFSAFVRIYIAFIFLIWSPSWDRRPSYKHFPSMKTFSHKFSKATTSWI